ncbi:MAG: ATP-binding protein [Limimaricola soesokkakensis]|uniref:ATP-binding protein n=1 Tax=Limimaricola soesokkakensis TaxID=1343159 RepID=UPI004058A34B
MLPFRRGDATEVGGGGRAGHGLGLAIALAIMEDHGGELRFCNRETGGLQIRLIMPATVEVS